MSTDPIRHRSGTTARLTGTDLQAQRAALVDLLPATDVVTRFTGEEVPAHGALTLLAARIGITPVRVRAAWAGKRVRAATIEKWRELIAVAVASENRACEDGSLGVSE